ncbi:hypothetical protein QF028_000040 [Neobacillus sp. B4I6]
MDQSTNKKEVITFKTKEKVTVYVHGKPNFNMWAKKMIELYNQKLNTSAS